MHTLRLSHGDMGFFIERPAKPEKNADRASDSAADNPRLVRMQPAYKGAGSRRQGNQRKERRMSAATENQAQLKVVIPHQMRRAIKIRVAEKETTVREFVEHAIEQALAGDGETRK